MLYPDPRTLQQLIDHHEEPLLHEADARHLSSAHSGSAAGSGSTPSGGTRTMLRHALLMLRHPGPQLHRMHL